MRYVLILLGLLWIGTANAIDCQTPPSCEELGYFSEPDPNCADDGYMFCPLDETYKKCVRYDCAKLGFTESDKTSWCKNIATCRGNPKYTLCVKAFCEIGDVYYSDGSCGYAKDYNPIFGKIPVGVVFYITDGGYHGKVASLKAFSSPWGLHGTDIKGLKGYNKTSIVLPLQQRDPDLFDGAKNTEIILQTETTKAECLNGTYTENKEFRLYQAYCIPTAALAVKAYFPAGVDEHDPLVGAGHWYFPALGELMDMYGYDPALVTEGDGTIGMTGTTKEIIEKTLSTLKTKGFTAITSFDSFENGTWSSTSHHSGYAWSLRFTTGLRYGDGDKSGGSPVRPVLAF